MRVVRDIEKVKQQVSTSTLGTSLGTGGMSTKLIAAELATAAGTTTVVMHSSNVIDIFKVIENGPSPCREVAETPALFEGPLCTMFLRRESALKDRKWWIAHGLHAAGTVVIDEGACRAIRRKESGGRLLPAGVVRVAGPFASHQAVRLVVRRRRHDDVAAFSSIDESTPGSPTPDLSQVPQPATLASPALRHLTIGTTNPITIMSDTNNTEPDTPQLQPSMSLSSSIASLDPLSRSVPPSPAITALAERLGTTSLTRIGRGVTEGESDEWEEVEVAKGLAQYNSVEIDRMKGRKSSEIEKLIGYVESEHVVDSITFL